MDARQIKAGESDCMIGILDFCPAGNVLSIANAFRRADAKFKIVKDLQDADGLDGLVIPGVGSFSIAKKLPGKIATLDIPVLGICLGMQALFEKSEEAKGVMGLGVFPGGVRKLKGNVKLPQLGWNKVAFMRNDPLFSRIENGEYFYFANSFAAFPDDGEDVLATTLYGERFASSVARGNFWGVQFHPEKSGRAGQALIGNFVGICKGWKK